RCLSDWSSDVCSSDLIGCGVQARAHLAALCEVRPIVRLTAFDTDVEAVERFVGEINDAGRIAAQGATNLREAARSSAIVVTSTRSEERRVGKECRTRG